MTYDSGGYFPFWLALILFLGGLALLGAIIKHQEKRKAKKRERQLQSLNRHNELRRCRKKYLAQMNEVLATVDGGKTA